MLIREKQERETRLVNQAIESDVKTASQMHVALRIAVHCWQYAPDVVPDMPQMMLFNNCIGTLEYCYIYVLIDQQLCSGAILW